MEKKFEKLCVRLIHCGNRNIANPHDNLEKNMFFIPMGLFALAQRLKKEPVDVQMIHLDLESSKNIEEILDFNRLDAVGFDCHWANQSLVVLNTIQLIKKIKPEVFVFMGGFTASFFAEEILSEYSVVDAIIRGDGEKPIVELCHTLLQKKKCGKSSFKDIPNLAWRTDNKQVIMNPLSYVATEKDLEQLDFAQIDLLKNWESYRDLSRFFSKFESINSIPQFILAVGRGCPYACTFCGGNARAQMCINNRKGQIIRSIDSVFSTVKKAMSYGFSLFFVDFDFEGSDDYYINLFKRFKEENLQLTFCLGSWGIPSRSVIDALSECCYQGLIQISPETGDPQLRKINKDPRLFYTNEELEERLEYISTKKNLKVQLFLGYFLPFDTEETIFTTMDFLTGIFSKYSSFTELFYGNLSTDPASLLYFYPEKYEIDIKPRCFNDYLTLLTETYVLRRGSTPDMTSFKPRDLSDSVINSLTGKIRLFNDLLFCFENPVLLLLKKVGRVDIISHYLREVNIPPITRRPYFTIDEIKNILLNISKEHNVLGPELIQSIDREYKKAALSKTFKLRQFYSVKNNERPELSKDGNNNELYQAKIENIISISKKTKFRDSHLDFDL